MAYVFAALVVAFVIYKIVEKSNAPKAPKNDIPRGENDDPKDR